MGIKVSVVLNTLNEQHLLERALKSVDWADEVVICDMNSSDGTVQLARKLGAAVYTHKKEEFVELARNFAVSKASNEWVLVIDPDEEIPASLAERLKEIASSTRQIDYVRIPRKNIIFGKWMQASMWWPDYNIRFFKKGHVTWTDKIHRPPKILGAGLDLPQAEKWAIIHNHYNSIVQFLERMMRYTKIQAQELKDEEYKFDWRDLIKKPFGEFLSRFFANRGFEDGLHGFILSLLQSLSFLIVYLRIWESEGFKEQSLNLTELNKINQQSEMEVAYWFKNAALSKNSFKRFFQRIRNKL